MNPLHLIVALTPLNRFERPVSVLFRRIGHSIAFNVYAVAVIYVRFAILTLVIYLVAQWFFTEFDMVAQDRETASAEKGGGPVTTSSTTSPPPSLPTHGEL